MCCSTCVSCHGIEAWIRCAVCFPSAMLASHADKAQRTFVDLVRYLCELPLPQAVHLQVVVAACKQSSAIGEAEYMYKTADQATLNKLNELWGTRVTESTGHGLTACRHGNHC